MTDRNRVTAQVEVDYAVYELGVDLRNVAGMMEHGTYLMFIEERYDDLQHYAHYLEDILGRLRPRA